MKKTFLSLSILLLILGCSEEDQFSLFVSNDYNQKLYKPNSTEDLGEILVVTEKINWENEIGQSLKTNFENLVTTTPLPYEKEFKLDFIDPKGLIKNIKKHNCILELKIDKRIKNTTSLPEPIFDQWANGQIIIKIKFNNQKSAVNFIESNASQLKQVINDFYYSKIIKNYSFKGPINEMLKKKYAFQLALPDSMKTNRSISNLIWLSQLTTEKDEVGEHEKQQGIIIYEYDYKDTSQFGLNKQIFLRDSLFKKHIINKSKGTFMTTRKEENSGNFSHHSFININGEYIVEWAGLWRVDNDKMGGPFVSVSRLNPSKTKIITIEGYVYAPNFNKGDLIRELKAVIYSLKWV